MCKLHELVHCILGTGMYGEVSGDERGHDARRGRRLPHALQHGQPAQRHRADHAPTRISRQDIKIK